MAVGPLATVIPAQLHRHISKNILKSYLSCTHEYTTKLQKDVEPANIPVITQRYDEQLYPAAVANKLNDLGREFSMDVHPWVLNTLTNWDELDHKICKQGEPAFLDNIIYLTCLVYCSFLNDSTKVARTTGE